MLDEALECCRSRWDALGARMQDAGSGQAEEEQGRVLSETASCTLPSLPCLLRSTLHSSLGARSWFLSLCPLPA